MNRRAKTKEAIAIVREASRLYRAWERTIQEAIAFARSADQSKKRQREIADSIRHMLGEMDQAAPRLAKLKGVLRDLQANAKNRMVCNARPLILEAHRASHALLRALGDWQTIAAKWQAGRVGETGDAGMKIPPREPALA